MNQSLALGKRAIAVAAASMTILWSVGVSAFVAPLSAAAATPGTLVKGTTLSTVYYYASNGSRYAFPNEKTYLSWYSDFSGVQTISDSELASIPLAGNVVYRPGTRWIKIQSDPKTYVVTPQGQIRWIESEEVAMGLAGSDWNQMIDDVPDVFFVDYTVGTSLTSATNAFNGALVSMSGNTYLVWDGMKRLVTSAGFTANWFQTRNLLDGSGITLAGLSAGADITSRLSTLTDPAQLGETITGGLSISLAPSTAVGTTVPGGADSVPFTTFKLMANGGPVTISSLVVNLGGVGATSNIDDVYLFDGNKRLTDGRSVNSSSRQVTFAGLNLSLANGEMKNLTVKADTATSAGGGDTANFSIASASSITSTATVSGSFPIAGNTMTFSAQDAGTVTVTANGSVADPTIGQEDALIGKLTLDADTEDAMLKELTLSIDNAADHSNFKLWRSSTLLATGTDIGSDLVNFVLTNPLLVEDGNDENLRVTADVGGENGDDLIVSIEESVDVIATGADFGFNMSVDVTAYDDGSSSCTECTRSTIQGGDLTFAFNGPASDDIQLGGQDQVIMKFSITAEQWAEIKEFDVVIDGDNLIDTASNPDVPNFEQFTLRRMDGTTWMGPEELNIAGSDTSQTLTFTDDQVLNAGETLDLMLTVDVSDSGDAADSETISATLDMSTVDAEDLNGDPIDNIVPGSDIVGHDFTLTDASITVFVATPPSSGTYVKGTSNVPVVGFSFEASDASDVVVTDLTLRADGDSDTDAFDADDIDVNDTVNSCSLYDSETGSLVDGPESLTTAETALFENFSWTVPAGETKKLIVKCNFANLAQDVAGDGAAAADAYVFYLGTAADVTAEDEDGDSVTVTTFGAPGDGNNPAGAETVVITIADSGTIAASLDGSTPKSTIILGNSTGVSVGSWKLTATNESFNVKKLTFLNGGDDVAAAGIKLSCQNQAGTTVTATSVLSGGSVSFSSLDCYVPSASSRVVTLSVDTNEVSSTGATSGDTLDFTLSTTVAGRFEAIGSGSGEKVTTAGANPAANEFTIRKTKPTISLASGSPSGASAGGLAEALRFNVAADSRGFVTLDAITFRVTAVDADTDWAYCDTVGTIADPTLWQFYDLGNTAELLDDDGDWAFFSVDGDTGAACDGDDDAEKVSFAELDLEGDVPSVAEEIGAGETRTYVVKVDTGATNDSDKFRLDIPSQNEVDATGFLNDAIRWDDDESDLTASTGDDEDINGDLLRNLPLTGGTLVF